MHFKGDFMKLFDLHCDTLFELDKRSLDLSCSNLAVSLDGMQKYDKIVRCFAIYTPDTLKGEDAQAHLENLYRVFQNQLAIYGNQITHIKDVESLEKAHIGAVLTVENGSVIAGDLCEIERLSKIGVKLFSLTWNGENELGFGQLKNAGLKPLGKECVRELEKSGIIIDVSHLSDRGFDDVCAISNKPFVASHSNARKICPHNRNLLDEQIKEIIARGGLIGLNFYKSFLNKNFDLADKYDIIRHAEHILSLGGENCLCIGTDFDGAEVIEEYDSDSRLICLENLFLQNGFSKKITDKILYDNAYNFFVNNFKEVQK